ncbi:nitrite/sulfite reductase [Ammonicoccus fulvus]|uniref:assimilatory sulfite reductase (ferredoxin) n=1 Tax=Ammonicoccus fulvus TaxID=3138240 RepID=A0ABZ3FSR2_9ACTN
MTTTVPAKAPRPARNAKPNGQWKVDGKTPLNPNEEFKAADGGLSVAQRIIDDYSKTGFASIPHDDLLGRMRWYGLYTQRDQTLEASRTGTLSDAEMSSEFLMMRVRIDGQALSTEALRVLGGISTDFARDTADITDRQNIQYHWIRVEDVPEIWDRLATVGLHTTEACGDTPRGFLASPVAGIAADELIDPTPVVEDIRERFIGDPELANLPRKFKTAITGHPSLDVVHEINDISLVGVEHPDLGVGYDLWVGGGLSTNPMLAKRVGVFVRQDEAAEVWHAVISIFRDYGYRRNRMRARLKFLVNDWGVEKFRQVLQEEYLGRELPDGPAPAPAKGNYDHVGVHEQKDGRVWVGAAPTVGRVSGTILNQIADLAEAAGSGRVTLTPHQKLLVLDVDPDKAETLVEGLSAIGLQARPSIFRRGTMACTGIEYCKLAFVETKGLAATLIDELETRLTDLDLGDTQLSINLNGCPNSCARIQVADIGLKGQMLKGEFGFQVHLGGGLADTKGEDGELGRTVRGLKVTAENLPDWTERIVRRYAEDRTEGESFAAWAHRAEDEVFTA